MEGALKKFFRENVGKLLFLVGILASSGVVIEVSGGIWDLISHMSKQPESFWSIQHVVVYTGVSITVLSALLCPFIVVANGRKFLSPAILLIAIGSVMQIFGGYADAISHDVYGIDGLITPSHLVLEAGLFIGSVGSFFLVRKIVKNFYGAFVRALCFVSMATTAIWFFYNFFLLWNPSALCLPVYLLFSSGCWIF